MQEQKNFGSSLKAFREKSGLTQSELAKCVGVQTQTIWRWEHGEREPSLDTVKRLSEVLGCNESELLNGPQDGKAKLVVSWNWEDMKKGEINMNEDKFNLILGEDGMIGLHGAGMMTSRAAIEEFLSKVRNELEIAFETQVRRGVIQEA